MIFLIKLIVMQPCEVNNNYYSFLEIIQERFEEVELVSKATNLAVAEAGFVFRRSSFKYNIVSNILPWGMLQNSGSQLFFNTAITLSKICGLPWWR